MQVNLGAVGLCSLYTKGSRHCQALQFVKLAGAEHHWASQPGRDGLTHLLKTMGSLRPEAVATGY